MNPGIRNPKKWALFLLAPLMLGSLMLSAQNPPTNPADDQETPTFKVDVNIVNIYFNVKDKRGGLIAGVTKDDVEVFEDGVKQNVRFFSAETNLPLTLGILIDTSGSQQRVLPVQQQAGAAFLNKVLREKDLAFLISFDVQVELLQDLTGSKRMLRDALDKTRINTGGNLSSLPGLGGGPVPIDNARTTALYDAIYLASAEKLGREVGRKAMIILTDGEDVNSRVRIEDAIEAAQKSDSIAYVIMIADRGFYTGFRGYTGDRQMRQLAEQTGGRVIETSNEEDLMKAFDQISNELRSQYSLGYTPSNNKQDGTFRKIEIKPKNKDYRVQARRGYYAPGERAPDESSKKKKK